MKKNKYIWMAVLPMFLSACQDEMIENSLLQNESVYTLSGKMTGGNALSRAQIQLGNTDASAGEVFLWNSGDSFKLYQSFDGQLKSSEFSISNDYSESGEGGNTTAVFTSETGAAPLVDYVAVYPADAPLEGESVKFNLQTSINFSNASQSEVWKDYFSNNMFMVASGKLQPDGANAIAFRHMCALARITYINQTNKEYAVKELALGGDQFFGTGKSYQVKQNFADGGSCSSHYSIQMDGLSVAAGDTIDLYAFFFPEKFNEGNLHITLKLDDQQKKVELPIATIAEANKAAEGFEAGMRYWFKLTDTGNGLTWSKESTAKITESAGKLYASILDAQQDPMVAERIAVYNWAGASGLSGENSAYLGVGRYSDSYNDVYYSYLTSWITNADNAVSLANNFALNSIEGHAKNFNHNIKAFARIWRAVMIAEYSDNFGPYPLSGLQNENPQYNSVKEVYYYILNELKEAVADISLTETVSAEEAALDPIFGYDAQKWAKYGNSLRLRYAMRLSEVDPNKAKSEFEAVDKNMLLASNSDIAKVPEKNEWNAWAGIYSRSWNYISLPSTMANILTGLGGVSVSSQRSDLASYTKPMDYLGLKLDQHYADCTDNPTKTFWLDGIPENLDPRALRLYCLPNDQSADNFINYGSLSNHVGSMSNPDVSLDAQFTWNYYPYGARNAWSSKFSNNMISRSYSSLLPVLSKTYGGESEGERVWFGPWETYFLLAEAALYGWNTGTTAEAAYENGIRRSFEHFGVSQYVDTYLNSTAYNRVGTSVKFSHTSEPVNFMANYKDGYTNESKTMIYVYPNAEKALYKGKKLNDQLAKIITQKYIAQAPYCTLEMWNDRRRLGLPWFDLPNNETTFVGSDMENTWTPTTYLLGQNTSVFPQRLRYPESLKNKGNALQVLGGENTTLTPLWWAIVVKGTNGVNNGNAGGDNFGNGGIF